MNAVELLKARGFKFRARSMKLTIHYAIRKSNRFLNRSPRTLLRIIYLKCGKNSHQVVKKTTSILLEGFGGSANSYLYTVFKYANRSNEKLQLAGHTHHSAQVIQAVQWKIPVVVIIRNPIDAICSLCAREPMCDVISSMDDKRLERHLYLPYKNVPVVSGTVTISRSLSTSTAAALICIRLRLPMGKPDEPK